MVFEHKPLKKIVKLKVREPNERQLLAVQYYMEKGGITKGMALRKAGYGESIIKNPKFVFGSPAVQSLLERTGVTADTVIHTVRNHLRQQSLQQVSVPIHVDDIENQELDEEDKPKHMTSTMTDGDIIKVYEETGCKVANIEIRGHKRIFWVISPNTQVQADAAQKLINIMGLEAPKNLNVDNVVTHQFSLSGLRKKAEELGIEVIQPRVIDI